MLRQGGREEEGQGHLPHMWRLLPPHLWNHICGGLCLFTVTSGGACAPRPDGGGPPGPSLASTSSPLGRERSLWAPSALPLPVSALAPL